MTEEFAIKQIRKSLNLTQAELAGKLGLTQASVSRLESGAQAPTAELLKKLEDLFGNEIPVSQLKSIDAKLKQAIDQSKYSESYYVLFEDWNIFSFLKSDQLDNGDFLKIKSDRSGKAFFLHGDMSGHGKDASYMATSLIFGFEIISSMVSFNFISSDFVNSILQTSIYRTKELWKDNPSLLTGMIDSKASTLEYINQGMPYPYYLSENGLNILDKRYSAIDKNNLNTKQFITETISINAGESLLFFSDGIFDIISEESLNEFIKIQSSYFRGDSQALGLNLTKIVREKIKNATDDISFFIISKGK